MTDQRSVSSMPGVTLTFVLADGPGDGLRNPVSTVTPSSSRDERHPLRVDVRALVDDGLRAGARVINENVLKIPGTDPRRVRELEPRTGRRRVRGVVVLELRALRGHARALDLEREAVE